MGERNRLLKPDTEDSRNIIRTGRIQDVEDGLSEMPHVILNQARVHDMYLEFMKRSPTRLEPDYGCYLLELSLDGDGDHPVVACVECAREDGSTRIETIRARYAVGCDRARSVVRKCIGRALTGESANKAWGVMDVLAVTDFPDIRRKTLIQSEGGSMLIIPREGGYLVRLYIELESLDEGERIRNRDITVDDLIAAAGRIFHPYQLRVRETAWWSVYEIGQRLADRFDNLDEAVVAGTHARIFIAGDACHTHSPKAGQGMNVSMADSFNLGWKLIAVLRGQSDAGLLRSYSEERHEVARTLLEFDQQWSRIISERSSDDGDAPKFQRHFIVGREVF